MMIAMALSCDPALVLADEPTTALDVTIQAQILELMKGLSRRLGVAMLIITHNLGVVARYADRVNVMYAGRIVERGTAREIYANPRHPYTLGLLRSVPRLDEPRRAQARADRRPAARPEPAPGRLLVRPALSLRRRALPRGAPPLESRRAPTHVAACWVASELGRKRDGRLGREASGLDDRRPGDVILEVRDLVKHFQVGGGLFGGRAAVVKAVDGVSFTIRRGETLGLVGESGCGKTTTGRCILQLERPTSGEVIFEGRDLTDARPRPSCGRCGGGSRSSSRTRTARSTRG